MENQETLQTYVGTPLTIFLPSGHTVTIREQNGDDDATLSMITKGKGRDQIDNLNRFISSIIIQNGFTNKPFMTVDEVESLRLRDKYYILLKSRMHSLGEEVVFLNTCSDKDCKHEMECTEDLKLFDADLEDYHPQPTDYKYAVKPYTDGGKDLTHEFDLASGKRVRFDYMTGKGEKKALEAYRNDASKNTELYARNFAIKVGNDWQSLGSMAVFGPKDMAQIRKEVEKWDSQFILASEVTCPKCGNEMLIPMNGIQDFFFLAGI
jgi:hypothetical protein